jgi:hypothetical protein
MLKYRGSLLRVRHLSQTLHEQTVGVTAAAADNRSLVQTNNVTELQHVAELLGAIWKDEMSA